MANRLNREPNIVSEENIKTIALNYTGEFSFLDTICTKNIPSHRLKLELDAMTAVILNRLKHKLFNNSSRSSVVDEISESIPQKSLALIAKIGEIAFSTTNTITHSWLNTPQVSSDNLLVRTNHYRRIYCLQAGLIQRQKEVYQSTEDMVTNRTRLLTFFSPGLIYVMDKSLRSENIASDNRMALIKNSGFLMVKLSQLPENTLKTYIKALNVHPELLLPITYLNDNYVARQNFTASIFNQIRTDLVSNPKIYYLPDSTMQDHPMAIDTDGTGSPIELGWDWLVNTADDLGYFN